MQDVLRVVFYPHMKYSWTHVEPKTAKIVYEFPYLTHDLNTAVITPTHSYELVQLPFGHPVWNMWMDNTHYAFKHLYQYINEQSSKFFSLQRCPLMLRKLAKSISTLFTEVCTVYLRVLQTLDNGTIPFVVPDKWTLISGDHVYQEFSVFVKLVQNNALALKVYVGEHELEIMPVSSGVVVSVDNKVVDNYGKGVMVPENQSDSYAIK